MAEEDAKKNVIFNILWKFNGVIFDCCVKNFTKLFAKRNFACDLGINMQVGFTLSRTEIISVTTHVPGKDPVLEYQQPKFVKKSKRQKREQLRQKRRKRKRKEEEQAKQEKTRKIEPKETKTEEEKPKNGPPKRKKPIKREHYDIWVIYISLKLCK